MIKFLLTLFFSTSLLAQDPVFFSKEMIRSHLKEYTQEEKDLIYQDLNVVRSICIKGPIQHFCSQNFCPQNFCPRTAVYLASAGSPGSRKSTILERFLAKEPKFSNAAYIDPDQRALKFMAHTYYQTSLSSLAIGEFPKYIDATKRAYEKWRSASKYIALTLLEEAFAQKRDIVHGTTSTGSHVPKFLSKIKTAGYEIVLLLCSSEDAFRKNAIRYRNEEQKFYQSTPEDAVKKGKLFPKRMRAYFTYADTLYLFWSDDLKTKERLAAIIDQNTLKIIDENAYQNFIQKHEKDRANLAEDIPSWDELIKSRCF